MSRVIAAAVVLATTLLASTAATAHAPIAGRTPTENSIVAKMPPAAEVLILDDGIGNDPGDYIRIYDSTGTNIAGALTATARTDATLLSAPISSTKSGWYAAQWNATFSDGHHSKDSMPSWWAFGVGVKAASGKATKLSLAPLANITTPMLASITGLRVGYRTLSIPVKGNYLGTVTWTLAAPSVATATAIKGASFTWTLQNNKSSKTVASAQGVLPFAGVYTVTLIYSMLSLSGNSVKQSWNASVTISS